MFKVNSLHIVLSLFLAFYASYFLYKISYNFPQISLDSINSVGNFSQYKSMPVIRGIDRSTQLINQTTGFNLNDSSFTQKQTNYKVKQSIGNLQKQSSSFNTKQNYEVLEIDKLEPKVRFLEELSTGNNFYLEYSLMVFAKYFGFSRNLIIIGTLTLMIDYMLPLIIFNESFLMLAFWTNEKHLMTPFYQQIFSAKYDLMNAVRIGFTNTDESALEILQRYGYSSGFFYNISGEFLFTIILGIITAIIKIANIFLKLEKIRQINSKLRPLWNGYIFCIMPRIMMFIGFEARSILQLSFFNVFNGAVSIIALTALIIFFVLLVVQVRRINTRIEYLEDSIFEIGLASRIDYKKDFEFDCLNYSILHYPAMNYFRLIWFFLAIGASSDFHYVQYSIPIVSQIVYIMISISCPCYKKNRDKVVYVVGDFLLIIVSLSMMAVGLAESVSHSQVSLVAQTIVMIIILQVTITYIGLIVADTIDFIRQQVTKGQAKEEQQEEQLQSSQSSIEEKKKKVEVYKKSNNRQTAKYGGKTTRKQAAKKKRKTEDDESQEGSDELDRDSAVTIKRDFKHPETNVKKVRIGKVI